MTNVYYIVLYVIRKYLHTTHTKILAYNKDFCVQKE